MYPQFDLAAIKAALNARAVDVARHYLGIEPTRRTASEVRFYNDEKLSLATAGPKAGLWQKFGGEAGDLIDLIAGARRCSFLDAVAEAERFLGGKAAYISAPPPPIISEPDDKHRKVELARRIWKESIPLPGTPAASYLERRGLWLPDGVDDIRFHPTCPRGADRLPAMVAAMRDTSSGDFIGVHRTFLTPDGRKIDGNAKQMLGLAGAIMLDAFDTVTLGLHIAEGIENALTARCNGWAPCWALGSAGAIEKFPVLGGVEALTILADADPVGRKAAIACAERWADAGIEVRVIEPKVDGADWNDVVRGVAA